MDAIARRLMPHLRRVARGPDDATDGRLLGDFVADRDEAAFTALVRRHGPMVLGVCRRVVGDAHLAEDAFQATFLVLSRRAASVKPRGLVGHWLYGVAYRTALKARGHAARRRERQVDPMPQPAVNPAETWADLQPILDEELSRLPEKHRVPVVLCDLGGRPQRDVAKELGIPVTTLTNRLAAARRLLAKRLGDRGVVLSGGAVAAALAWHATTSAVPPALGAAAVRLAVGGGVAALPITELTEGVMRMFIVKKLKAVAATGAMVLAGLGVAGSTLRAEPESKPEKPPVAKAPVAAEESADAKFFRETSRSLRGTDVSGMEMAYFLSDADKEKRGKVAGWMLPGHGKQAVTESCGKCHTNPSSLPWLSNSASFHRAVIADPAGSGLSLNTFHGATPAGDTGTSYGDFIMLFNPVTVEAKDRAAAYPLLTQRAADKPSTNEFDKIAAEALAASQLQADLDKASKELARQRQEQLHYQQALLDLTQQQELKALGDATYKSKDADAEKADAIKVKLWNLLQARRNQSPADADREFLRRTSLDLRGTPPTAIEMNYFLADPDPKKREKLGKLLLSDAKPGNERVVAELLKDVTLQQKYAKLMQERIDRDAEASALKAVKEQVRSVVDVPKKDRFSKLLDFAFAEDKSDEQLANVVFLATMARYPTDAERDLVSAATKGQPDRRAAWAAILKTLSHTTEAKSHGSSLSQGK